MTAPLDHKATAEKVVRSLAATPNILLASAQLEVIGGPDPRDDLVRRALERSAEVVRACTDLGQSNNPTALGVLARAHLEALIQMLWVTLSSENAVELSQGRSNEVVRMARINMQSGKLRVVNKITGGDETKKFLSDDRMKIKSRRKSVEAYAEEAGVKDLYNVFYRFMSLDVHGHNTDAVPETSDWQLTAMHLQGIGGLTQALGHTGIRWLLHRQRPTNEELRALLGLPQ